MTLYQFKAFNENEQHEVLSNKGVYLTHIITAGYKFALYQIDAFYIEVKYDADMNKILGLRTFRSVSQLEQYLKNIELPRFD
jgi:hypothetical protein